MIRAVHPIKRSPCCKSQQLKPSIFAERSHSTEAEESSHPGEPSPLMQCNLIDIPEQAPLQPKVAVGEQQVTGIAEKSASPVIQRYVKVGLYEGSFGLDHIGVGVNSEKTLGFSPKEGLGREAEKGSWVDGEVKEDHGLLDSLTIRTNPRQEARLQAAMNRSESSPQKFNLRQHNCSQHGAEILKSAGLNAKSSPVPRAFFEGLKKQYASGQNEAAGDGGPLQGKFTSNASAAEPGTRPNRTGMPDRLKSGIESLSGMDMSDVRVHANSDQPARLDALAYTQGNQIYLGPGEERHLPHEAWHVVQQKQGRVRATDKVKGLPLNDSSVLEFEADSMGPKASQINSQVETSKEAKNKMIENYVVQEIYNAREGVSSIVNLPKNKTQKIFQLMADPEVTTLGRVDSMQHGFGGPINKDDLDAIVRGCGEVKKFFDKNIRKLKLLHIGVGVGNPDYAFGNNPSVAEDDAQRQILKSQENPGFLSDASNKGYAVAYLIFNNLENKVEENESFLKIIIKAKFPLTDKTGLDIDAFKEINSIKSKADRFSIMNSVTQSHYGNLLDLGKDSRISPGKSRYLHSYIYNKQRDEAAYLSAGGEKWLKKPADGFSKFDSVFFNP